MDSILDAPQYHDETPPTSTSSRSCGRAALYARTAATVTEDRPPEGQEDRTGLRKCYECMGKFTVKMGRIFEDSHAPMTHWLQAIHLMCSSKKGISTRQIQRTLGGA